ncbi:MAG: glycosyltransferase family 2 protein [Betaproteobacteria bacterium]|jgi:GT2 family glycosyltransferase|nr:glycosyltransferase family 2 protein [Betaproteobacteria bacterium]
MRLTAVIPTRNRPADLGKAVASVLAQTRLPDTLMIVDQSPGDESRLAVESQLAGGASLRLDYVHDTAITGLVDAKRVAAGRADGDVVCFLEDDIVLEADFFEQIERGFVERPEMLGCCGVVTNLPPLPAFYVTLFHLFHRGMFADRRVGIHGFANGRGQALIASDYLSGGLSAYRREVFAAVPFDTVNELFMTEDIDFSTRAARHFGAHFFINPNARLAHHMSPVNRAAIGARQRRKAREFFVFYKKRRTGLADGMAFAWLLCGLAIEACFAAARYRRMGALAGFFAGIGDGMGWRVREIAGRDRA